MKSFSLFQVPIMLLVLPHEDSNTIIINIKKNIHIPTIMLQSREFIAK